MNFEIFRECFNDLCLTFDLDPERKLNRINAYYSSKIGELSELDFNNMLNKAKHMLSPKHNKLPSIKDLIGVYYTLQERRRPKRRSKEDMENWEQSLCVICGGIGFVIMEDEDGDTCSGMCCTCIKGQRKHETSEIGRESGFYTEWLDAGYKLHNHEAIKKNVPF